MKLSRKFQIKWINLKRNRYIWFFLLFNYIFLALIDKKGHIFLENKFLYIYRFIHQQLYIILTLIFFINIFLTENTLIIIENFMIIYIKNIRKELRTSLLLAIFMNIFMFFIGQVILGTVNFIYFFKIPSILLLINFLIVSIEIITTIFFISGLRLLFRKNIFVYSIYYIYIFFSLVINNIWVTIPLTAKLLGETEKGYYFTFRAEVWISRIILLTVSLVIYYLGEKKFIKNLK